MKKEFNHIEDFLQELSFRRWVLDPDAGKNLFWENWQKENPEKQEVLENAAGLLKSMATKSQLHDQRKKATIFGQINAQIEHQENKRKWERSWLSTAAALVLIICAALFFYIFSGGFLHSPKSPEGLTEVEQLEKQSEKGQKTKFILPDGSTVYLNSASRIVYDSDFSIKNRGIFLEGEAYFEVAPDSLLPFIVTSRDVTVQALGTSFNINAYDEQFTVQLTSGWIKVQNNQDQVFLDPGLESTLTQDESFFVKAYDLNKAAPWKDGILLFERTPLKECLKQLERWYNVEFEIIGDMPANAVVSGKFDNDYLVNVMESIAFSLNIKFKLDGKKVTLHAE